MRIFLLIVAKFDGFEASGVRLLLIAPLLDDKAVRQLLPDLQLILRFELLLQALRQH